MFGVSLHVLQGVELRVTDFERCLVDIMDRPDLSGSWEEIWRSLESVEFFDPDKVMEYALLLGNATTAAFLGGVMIHGLRPGMDLFSTNAAVTYSLFVGLILANVCFFLIGMVAINWFAKITLIKNELLVPAIILLSMVGSFGLNNRFADIIICLVFGILGYFFQKYGFPVIAVVLGMILGPIGERGFHQSLLMSKGSYLIFFTRPISLILFLLTVLVLFSQLLKPYWESYKEKKYQEKIQN